MKTITVKNTTCVPLSLASFPFLYTQLKVLIDNFLTHQFPSAATKKLNNESSGTVVVWHIMISLVSGIIIGILVCYIVWCSCRRWLRTRRPQSNPEAQTTEADTTYQELDLSKMNTEDNYQSLRVNAASNNVANDDDSTYTELSKTRDEENKYQSLT